MTDRTPITEQPQPPFTWPLFLKFLLPSTFGILIFLTPITVDGKQTILMSILIDWLKAPIRDYLLDLFVGLVIIAATGGLYFIVARPAWKDRRPFLYAAFHVTPLWAALRLIGALFGVMVYFQIGPELVWGDSTGRSVFIDIGVSASFTLGLGILLMPFLTDYGLLEFVGVLARRPFRLLFRLPGRAAIDALASFVSASSIGVLITVNQYEAGYYSARQSAAVATNFSVVSIPFALLIAKVAGLEDIFFTWYLVVALTCIVCAMVMVRIPPLSLMKDDYFPASGKRIHEDDSQTGSDLGIALSQALAKAKSAPGPKDFVIKGVRNALDVLCGVLPVSMAIATTAAILVFHTEIFNVIAMPITMLLDAAGLPNAKQAAPGFLVGFLDQFMPTLIAKDIDSDLTRFILAGLSVTQLIYMAEVGIIILRSSLPIAFTTLFLIFIIRTIIATPILWIAGRLIL